MIHCIGDSHSAVFSGIDKMIPMFNEPNAFVNNILPDFRAYCLGPATAYALYKDAKIEMIDSIVSKVNDDDYVMFVFGEVDCRLHLGIHDNIVECIDNYVSVISKYNKICNLIVCGPIASAPDDIVNPETPFHGSCLDRNDRTLKFNTMLKEKCDELNVPFITAFYTMLNDDGTTNYKYLKDNVHASQKIMPSLIEQLKQLNILTKGHI